jgi:mRNA-degrading endonuclease HigB of HigAB toxin-antitoxin module
MSSDDATRGDGPPTQALLGHAILFLEILDHVQLTSGRVVFNIKGNDFRLVAVVQYEAGVMMIRFFGSHEDYDKVNAETV